jgi:hypothetical protein
VSSSNDKFGVHQTEMSNALRSLKRRQDKTPELPPEQQKLPTGRVLTEPLRGSFQSFPLLAWISVRHRDRIPLVMLVLALLESETTGIRGTLELELPLYIDTEAATLAALERYGWTGAVWANGDPPPLDSIDLAEQLKGLLGQTTTKLKRTLVFAPDPATGNTLAQTVEVSRAKGRFLMPPLEIPATPPSAERLETLRNLVLDYRSFFEMAENVADGVRDIPT